MMSTTVRPSHRLATLLRRKGGGPTYLLRDEFNTDAVAPLASPRACEPGPGTLTLVQIDGQFSISGSKLVFPAQATPVWGDQSLSAEKAGGGGLTRTAGRALLCKLLVNATAINVFVAWATTPSSGYSTINSRGLYLTSTGTNNIAAMADDGSEVPYGSYAAFTEYDIALVLRTTGVLLLIKGGVYTNWTLLLPDNSGNTATLYPVFVNYNAIGTLDSFRVTDLPAPWNSDYGIATDRKAGGVAAGTTFTHTADCLIEWTQTTLSSGGQFTDVTFRRQDASNLWFVEIDSAGTISLYERVATADALRGRTSTIVLAGHRVVVVADGSVIRIYTNNTLRFTYSLAPNFQALTSGSVNPGNLGWTNGGTVSDLTAWPRYPNFPSNV